MDDYRLQHRAPSANATSARLDDLTPAFTDDVYAHPDWFGVTDEFVDGLATIRGARGRPELIVTVYRALPADVPQRINRGDWVTVSRVYAVQHGMQDDPADDWPVISAEIPASSLYCDGSSPLEFGYDPRT